MIRFCDKEVYCVSYEQIDRSALLNYFFQGNMDEGVCVQNPDGTYRGWISYYSLIHCENVKEAVWEDCVVPGRGIWEQARKFFACHEYRLHENVLLPVTDQAGNLICFAYEDGEANREIRMLRELKELSAAIGFSDLYPQYDCVKICGCNELAVLFAAYLKDRGIAVKTEGELGIFSDRGRRGISGLSVPYHICGRRGGQKKPKLGGKPVAQRIAGI